MKLLLVWLDIRSNGVLNPHHGLASLAGHLAGDGHHVRCIHVRTTGQIGAIPQAVADQHPDCVGFSVVTNQRHYLDRAVAACRRRHDGLVVAGGIHATLAPRDVLACDGIDGVCVGEGERPMAQLAGQIDRGGPCRSLDCFIWKARPGLPEPTPHRPQMFAPDLAQLSRPDYSIFNMPDILAHGSVPGIMSVMVSRGCPYNCTYCCNKAIKSSYPQSKGYFRMLEPDAAVDLLASLVEQFDMRGFNFGDDLLVCNRKWFSAFTERYVERIARPYVCNSRVEMLQSPEIASMLKDSGCLQVSFGLESGDEELRRTVLNRTYTNQQVRTAARLLHEVNLPFSTYNIMGFPGETRRQMQRTLDLNREIRPTTGMVFFFFPYPGTELHERCLADGLVDSATLEKVDGFTERPVIRMTHCTERDCLEMHRRLFLYFKTRKAARVFHVDRPWFDSLLYGMMRLAPGLFLKLGRGKFLPRFLRT